MIPLKQLSFALTALLLIVLFSATSCNKYRQRQVFGTLLDSASQQPVVNKTYYLYVTIIGSPLSSHRKTMDQRYYFKTDEHGYFKLVFESKDQKIVIGNSTPPAQGGPSYWTATPKKKEISINAGFVQVGAE